MPSDELENELARKSLQRYTERTFAGYQPAWHLRLLNRYLDRVVDGDIRRLMIFMPPRHGKTEAVSLRLPTKYLGQYPDNQVMACSYGESLTADINLGCQRILDGEPYRDLFPDTTLVKPGKRGAIAQRTKAEFDVVDRRGAYRCAGVGGPIVGKGFDLGIIDDPIKTAKEANSRVYRDSIATWYRTGFYTRQMPDAAIVLMHQRWHNDDLAGRLLKLAAKDPLADQWTVLSLPAIAEAPLHPEDPREIGEPLWPERYDLDFLNRTKAGMPAWEWAALYQQRPTQEGGNHFQRGWFAQRWLKTPGGQHVLLDAKGDKIGQWQASDLTIFTTCDPAATAEDSSDPTAMGVWAFTPLYDLLCLDMVVERLPIEAIVPRLLLLNSIHRARWTSIEDSPKFVPIIEAARRRPGMPPVRALSHGYRSKLNRATPAIILASDRKIFLPLEARWVEPFIEEHIAFTGNDGDEDNQVDNTAYAVWQRPGGGEATASSRNEEEPPKAANAERVGICGRGKDRSNGWRRV